MLDDGRARLALVVVDNLMMPREMLDEVKAKVESMRHKSKDSLVALLITRPVPIVIGPEGRFYLVDHHHLARAVWELCQKKNEAGVGPENARVVVKVQRPGIEDLVRTDLAALRVVARWVMRYKPIRKRANVPALMEEFARTLWQELDYRAEETIKHLQEDSQGRDE